MELTYFMDVLEIEFYLLTGINLQGIVGLFIGLMVFTLLLLAIRYEKRNTELNSDTSVLTDVGDSDDAKINLSRSFLEMGQKKKANELLEAVLSQKGLSEEKRINAESLLRKSLNG